MRKWLAVLFLSFLCIYSSRAQFIEDALRLAVPNGMITPRVAGLNVAYYGLSDDIGALLFNPAGMAFMGGRTELSVGLGFTRNSTETSFLGNLNEYKFNSGFLSNLGIITPLKSGKIKGTIGIGYFQESDFDNTLEMDVFNTENSRIGYESRIGTEDNFATQLYLAGLAPDNYATPLTRNLRQQTRIEEKGGLHNITGAMAFELNDYLALGLSLSGKWGTYSYDKEFIESDRDNLYKVNDTIGYTDIAFRMLTVTEKVDQDISGITGSVSLMGKLGKFLKAGVLVKFPTFYDVTETFSLRATPEFDSPPADVSYYEFGGESSYEISTPFIYGGGVSVNGAGVTFSAGVEYTDATQLEFHDGPDELENVNRQMEKGLVGQVTWGFGAEYKIPILPIAVRASYAMVTSPYVQDVTNAAVSYFGFGAGLYLGDNIRLDGVVRFMEGAELRTYYGSNGDNPFFEQFQFSRAPFSIGLGMAYRY